MDKREPIAIIFRCHLFEGYCTEVFVKDGLLVTNFYKQQPDDTVILMHILARCYAINWDVELDQEGKDAEAGEILVVGKKYEGVWPDTISFGELSFSSNPDAELEIKWRYKGVLVVPSEGEPNGRV